MTDEFETFLVRSSFGYCEVRFPFDEDEPVQYVGSPLAVEYLRGCITMSGAADVDGVSITPESISHWALYYTIPKEYPDVRVIPPPEVMAEYIRREAENAELPDTGITPEELMTTFDSASMAELKAQLKNEGLTALERVRLVKKINAARIELEKAAEAKYR